MGFFLGMLIFFRKKTLLLGLLGIVLVEMMMNILCFLYFWGGSVSQEQFWRGGVEFCEFGTID